MEKIPMPTENISPKVISVWRIYAFMLYGLIFLLLGMLLFIIYYYHWFDWIRIILLITIGIIIFQAGYQIILYPMLLQKTWYYSMNEDYVQIRFGFLHTVHTVIPISHIEYVQMRQGPIFRHFDLMKLTIGTITTTTKIPAITAVESRKLHDQIVLNLQTHIGETDE